MKKAVLIKEKTFDVIIADHFLQDYGYSSRFIDLPDPLGNDYDKIRTDICSIKKGDYLVFESTKNRGEYFIYTPKQFHEKYKIIDN